MSDSKSLTVAGDKVTGFIECSGMTKVALEPLLGLSASSRGKTLTRWELYGPTPTATILMAYMARYGFDLAREIVTTGEVDLVH